MKKLLCAFLALCLTAGLTLVQAGTAETPYEAVVANPRLSDRLNLRQKPDEKADSLGRFYSGTPVTVYDTVPDGQGQEWAKVEIGLYTGGATVSGYMLAQYLMAMNRNYEAPQLFHTASPAARQTALLSAARNNAGKVGYCAETVYVLGDIGDDWRFVINSDYSSGGFVRAARLKEPRILVESAYAVCHCGGPVAVYQDKNLKKQEGTLYEGAPVQVVDYSRTGGWAAVQCYGVSRSWRDDGQQVNLSGYVPVEDILVFRQPWQVSARMKTGVTLEEFTLDDPQTYKIPCGASLTVAGELNGNYLAVYGGEGEYAAGWVPKSKIKLTDRTAGLNGVDRLGYCWVSMDDWEGYPAAAYPGKTEEAERTWAERMEIIGEGSDGSWLQVRNEQYGCFYIDSWVRGIRFLKNGDLFHELGTVLMPGEWMVDGLWFLTVEPGQEAKMTVREDEKTWEFETLAGEKTEYYSFFFKKNTAVTLNGGVLTAMTESNAPRLTPKALPNYTDDTPVFEGSGRYFCDAQVTGDNTWFSYYIQPLSGNGESWFQITDLFTGVGEDGALLSGVLETERFDDADAPLQSEWGFELRPGQFLEVHNCRVVLCFGNG